MKDFRFFNILRTEIDPGVEGKHLKHKRIRVMARGFGIFVHTELHDGSTEDAGLVWSPRNQGS